MVGSLCGATIRASLRDANNIQSTGAKNSALTAGKYMVIAEGKLNQQFFGSGVKFDENFVIMANDFDMQIQEPQNNA